MLARWIGSCYCQQGKRLRSSSGGNHRWAVLFKSSHVVRREGRATASDAIACFRGNGKTCSFFSPPVRAGDDGENTDMVDRAPPVLGVSEAEPHQHLFTHLSFI